jgi:hypothetical protein
MKARTLVTWKYGHTVNETIREMMEECEMKATNAITTVNNEVDPIVRTAMRPK